MVRMPYSRVASDTNFIMIIGPMVTTSSYRFPRLSMSSFISAVTLPWKPSLPSSVEM